MIPVFLHPPQDVVAETGQDVAITCAAQGDPRPTITWVKVRGDTTQRGSGSFSSSLIKLSQLNYLNQFQQCTGKKPHSLWGPTLPLICAVKWFFGLKASQCTCLLSVALPSKRVTWSQWPSRMLETLDWLFLEITENWIFPKQFVLISRIPTGGTGWCWLAPALVGQSHDPSQSCCSLAGLFFFEEFIRWSSSDFFLLCHITPVTFTGTCPGCKHSQAWNKSQGKKLQLHLPRRGLVGGDLQLALGSSQQWSRRKESGRAAQWVLDWARAAERY